MKKQQQQNYNNLVNLIARRKEGRKKIIPIGGTRRQIRGNVENREECIKYQINLRIELSLLVPTSEKLLSRKTGKTQLGNFSLEICLIYYFCSFLQVDV